MVYVLVVVIGVVMALLGAPDLHAATYPTYSVSSYMAVAPIAAVATTIELEPILVSIMDAAELLATSRSQIYQRIARGELAAVRDRGRVKVTYESVKRLAAGLPKAKAKLYVPRPRV